METNKIYQGDSLEVLKTFPDESINCVMTSPPYWALRDYEVEGQLGLEPTFQEYIIKLCDIFDEVKRVLRKDGTCWVNIGDTYNGSNKGVGGDIKGSKQIWSFNEKEKRICQNCGKEFNGWKFQNFCGSACSGIDNTPKIKKGQLENKSLCNIPARFSIEMQNRGWILRNVIIWHKPNCMPSSVKDRFTVDFEYIFFFVKNKNYWFEMQYEKSIWADKDKRSILGRVKHKSGKSTLKNYQGGMNAVDYTKIQNTKYKNEEQEKNNRQGLVGSDISLYKYGKNKRCIWDISTKPFKESHFATYPEELCYTPIKSGCPENGIILDPFFGAGTTGLVALKQNKKFIGIELNSEYIKIANKRLKLWLNQKKLI
jgi:DNA modification methylase